MWWYLWNMIGISRRSNDIIYVIIGLVLCCLKIFLYILFEFYNV